MRRSPASLGRSLRMPSAGRHLQFKALSPPVTQRCDSLMKDPVLSLLPHLLPTLGSRNLPTIAQPLPLSYLLTLQNQKT